MDFYLRGHLKQIQKNILDLTHSNPHPEIYMEIFFSEVLKDTIENSCAIKDYDDKMFC